jgi:NAD(P)H-hydrate epimerase
MDVLSAKEMMAREEAAFRSGITAVNLMEAAGEAMAQRITTLYPRAQKFLVLVGKGNNGGDGLVVARHLASTGKSVRVVLTAPEDQLGELPQIQVDRLRRPFPNLEILPWRNDLDFPGSDGVVIDALLGIRARGALRGTIAEAVAQLNSARAERFFRTVALDLPSGLAAYEDEKPAKDRDIAVVADVTLAVGFAKEVLCREALSAWVGRLEVIPWSQERSSSTPHQVLVGNELAGLLPRRSALSHKNDFGRLAIVAGNVGFTGASVLCAQAALAMGAGLTTIVTRHETESIIAASAPPEVMVSGWIKEGITPEAVQMASAIILGPGLGVNGQTAAMLRTVLARGCPVLIDADGLNVLAQNMELLCEATGPVLLTPHPGEMSRLIKRKFTSDERESVARAFADQYQVTLVLKGTRTLIAAPDQSIFINTTGNPGLSIGGSGDTLSGILGALLAQGLSPLDAARLGVWLHGHAADLILAVRDCEEGLTPTMLSSYLGAALVSLRTQAVASRGLLEHAKGLG